MPGIWIVIDYIVSARYAHIHYVMRARHFSSKVRRWLAGLCVDGGTLYFWSSEFNVFFFDDAEVCLRRLRLARIHSAFAVTVRSGVERGLQREHSDDIRVRRRRWLEKYACLIRWWHSRGKWHFYTTGGWRDPVVHERIQELDQE